MNEILEHQEKKYGDVCIIPMRGCLDFARQVEDYLRADSNECAYLPEHVIVNPKVIRFGNGEGKVVFDESLRGRDVYILCDPYNYGESFTMYEREFFMTPDDHFQDLKRAICAIGGKASRLTVIMPMLYEGRQDKRSLRESLDCAIALQELVSMGVQNIISFDVHNGSVQNAIPLTSFDNIHPTYQMIKALVKTYPHIKLDPRHMMIISPDEGGMSRCMYYSSVLNLDLGMFYKRRDYSQVVDGKNPILAHEYLGQDLHGKDAIIVDDIISSGGSMLDVAKQLKEKGAKDIYMFATFGLFCNGLKKFDEAYAKGLFTRVFTTNTIYRSPELLSRPWYHEVNLCKYVSFIVKTLNHDKSINEVLKPLDKIHQLLDSMGIEHN